MTATPGAAVTAPARRSLRITPALLAPPVLGALLGLGGGWLWWTWWGPPVDGRIYDTRVGPTWYPDPFDPGITRDFSGTATYVVLGFGLGLLLGVIAALVCRNTAVPGVVAVLVGSGLGAGAMVLLGLSLSPADPASLVEDHKIGDVLPDHLHVAGWTPYLIWPVGALVGYAVVMLILSSRWEQPPSPTGLQG